MVNTRRWPPDDRGRGGAASPTRRWTRPSGARSACSCGCSSRPPSIGIVLFTVVPIVASILLAFFRWDIISDPEFVGVDNFADIGGDPTVRVAFLNTFGFVVIAVAAPARGRPRARRAGAVPDADVAARVLPLRVLLPADPVGGVGLAGDGVPVQRGLRPRQPGAERGRPGRRAVADHRDRRRDGGGPGLRLAELRVLVPAVRRRPRLDPAGRLRGVLDRRRDRLAPVPQHHPAAAEPDDCWSPR